MHFSLIPVLALVVVFVAQSTNAASIRKTEPLEKQSMQEKMGKESKVSENPDEEVMPVAQSADKKKPGKDMGIDQNGDGKISEEEYAAFLKRRESEYKNELRQALQDTLTDFDKSEDGKLQEEEIVHLLAATRNLRPKTDFKPIFAEVDGNGDGSLDLDELEFFLQHTPWNLLEEIPSSEVME